MYTNPEPPLFIWNKVLRGYPGHLVPQAVPGSHQSRAETAVRAFCSPGRASALSWLVGLDARYDCACNAEMCAACSVTGGDLFVFGQALAFGGYAPSLTPRSLSSPNGQPITSVYFGYFAMGGFLAGMPHWGRAHGPDRLRRGGGPRRCARRALLPPQLL